MIEHGGGILAAAKRYGHAQSEWLDLSTGVSPYSWTVGEIPTDAWRRFPEEDDGLLDVARDYYGAAHVAATAGSQGAIGMLPSLRAPSTVAIISPTYAEHAYAWSHSGHAVHKIDVEQTMKADAFDVVVACNPNNPTAASLPREMLLEWHARLARRSGWLVVDEAYADADGAESVVRDCGAPGLIVLRSLGKFFGLAGLRVGFVAAWPALIAALRQRLGPWPVNTPARWIAQRALGDRAWQRTQRRRLVESSARLTARLRDAGLPPAGKTALFAWVPTPNAGALARFLGERAILIRAFANPPGVRFGLPGLAPEWARLDVALAAWQSAHA